MIIISNLTFHGVFYKCDNSCYRNSVALYFASVDSSYSNVVFHADLNALELEPVYVPSSIYISFIDLSIHLHSSRLANCLVETLTSYTSKYYLYILLICLILFKFTLRCQINAPPLINFLIFFPTPRTLFGPPFIVFKEIYFVCKPFISFPFFASTIYAQFSKQIIVLPYIF